jgi:beta-glucosidase
LQKPIYITESGVPDPDDTIRPGYLIKTVRAVWRAVNFNFPVRGFFFWSLLDNFEWSEGYDPQFSFGLYGVNFETQERTQRQSARLYKEICTQNGLSSGTVQRYAPELFDQLFPGSEGKPEVTLKPRTRP